ncbi:MAG TPA: 2-phospho-L-lactate transferase [Terriglobales bacterium]|nr:2-phospho-L-lactate transferase [Terriglobales bacterium]
MITVLTGGTGGAKFIEGLARVVAPPDLTLIVNTGDDFTCWNLHISPDIDSITYALAGMLSRERGWGVKGDTFECLAIMERLGEPAWFRLGDRDLATHITRTGMLAAGKALSEATRAISTRLGVRQRVLPMSDQRVETRLVTPKGELTFQEYFVRERYRVPVGAVRFDGAEAARPAPGVLEAIRGADAVLIAPSNPVTSIWPILAVPGIREALRQTEAPVVAISPIVGGAAVSGPAAELMRTQGLPASSVGVARAYEDFLSALIADLKDKDEAGAGDLASMNIQFHFARTIMRTDEDKVALAEAALRAAGVGAAAR